MTAINLGVSNLVDALDTVTQLAIAPGSDHTLVLRILRVIAAFGFIDEIGEQCYGPNRLSKGPRLPDSRDLIKQTVQPTPTPSAVLPYIFVDELTR